MIKTEMRNENTTHIDRMTTEEMMRVMQNENMNAVKAVEKELSSIARAVDAITERMAKGGRLFYIGCGTSGRLGIVDASECPPTYGIPHGVVVGIIAGGDDAIRRAVENAEDSFEMGYNDLKAYELSLAGEVGALKVALSNNEGCPIELMADIGIHPDTGAEVVTGSTRMKAGSSHKMILNMISTAVMIKLGHVYENLMINLRPANIKLRDRMIRIVCDILGTPYDESERLLLENDFVIRRTIEAYKK